YETRFGPADPSRGYVTEELKKKHENPGDAKPAAPGPVELAPPTQKQGHPHPEVDSDDEDANEQAGGDADKPGATGDASQANADADAAGGQPPRANKADELGLTPLPPAQ